MPNITTALETYLRRLGADPSSAVPETSRYGHLQTLINTVGERLPGTAAHAIVHPADTGAGIPDLGLFAADQAEGTRPQHGVVEAKPASADVYDVAQSEQVRRYLLHYGQVLVTNYRDFLLVTLDDDGRVRTEEYYRLAPSEDDFWQAVDAPRPTARRHGPALGEYLTRVLRRSVPLRTPQEVAQVLASYAREARARIEQDGVDLSALTRIRRHLEEGLGLHFQADQGEAFFRSSLEPVMHFDLERVTIEE